MKKDRADRKKRKEAFITAATRKYLQSFMKYIDDGVNAEDIKKNMIIIHTNKIRNDPQNTHLYNEAVKRFSKIIENGLEKARTEVENTEKTRTEMEV